MCGSRNASRNNGCATTDDLFRDLLSDNSLAFGMAAYVPRRIGSSGNVDQFPCSTDHDGSTLSCPFPPIGKKNDGIGGAES